MFCETIRDLNVLDYVTTTGSCTRTQESLGEKAEEKGKAHMGYNSEWAIDYESLKSLVGTKHKIATEIKQPAIW